jgi:8-oxo-dGTP pyrophosphatase MutT (NUDIX family)
MKIRPTAGGVIIGPENKIALTNQQNDSWSLPKGGVDPGEDMLEAAKREIREETGITELEIIKRLGQYQRHRIPRNGTEVDSSEVKDITMFLFRTPQKELAPTDPRNPEAVWANVDDVSSILTHDKDKEFFQSRISDIKAEF